MPLVALKNHLTMHYLGVLVMVHFEAKKLGLRGLRPDEMPVLREVLARRWLTYLPATQWATSMNNCPSPTRRATMPNRTKWNT